MCLLVGRRALLTLVASWLLALAETQGLPIKVERQQRAGCAVIPCAGAKRESLPRTAVLHYGFNGTLTAVNTPAGKLMRRRAFPSQPWHLARPRLLRQQAGLRTEGPGLSGGEGEKKKQNT